MAKGSSKKLGSKPNPLTSQGVRDLNSLGPKRPKPPATSNEGTFTGRPGPLSEFPYSMLPTMELD